MNDFDCFEQEFILQTILQVFYINQLYLYIEDLSQVILLKFSMYSSGHFNRILSIIEDYHL